MIAYHCIFGVAILEFFRLLGEIGQQAIIDSRAAALYVTIGSCDYRLRCGRIGQSGTCAEAIGDSVWCPDKLANNSRSPPRMLYRIFSKLSAAIATPRV